MANRNATRDQRLSHHVNSHEKAQIEVLADHHFGCSLAEVVRTVVDETYTQLFGDLDPEAIVDGRVPSDLVEDVSCGEVEPEEVAESVGSDVALDDVGERQREPAADGGAVPHPSSYHANLSPVELARQGPTLSWSDLREAVADDGHWSDDLEIHPDRVPERELKSNHKYTPRIVAAMCRARATGELIPGDVLDDVIDEHLMHLHDRHDVHAGRQYVRDTYVPLVEEHLRSNPSATATAYITDEEWYHDIIEDTLDQPAFANVELNDGTIAPDDETALDVGAWACGQEVDLMAYRDNVARYLEHLADVWNLHINHADVLDEHAFDYPEDGYDSPDHWVLSRVKSRLDLFREYVPDQQQNQIITDHVDDAARETLVDLL